MSEQTLLVIIYAVKIIVVFGAVLTAVPFMVLLERVLIARIQQRVGPNRVGFGSLEGLPFIPAGLAKRLNKIFMNRFILGGILQTFIDGAKLFLKEDTKPVTVDKVLHALAPLLTVVPAIFLLAVIPFGPEVKVSLFGHQLIVPLSITDLEIGLLFYLAVTGIAVYGIVLAGWASNSKYSLLGGIRSSAQMLSYELAMGLSLVGLLLIAGTFDLRAIINQQAGSFWSWNVIKQPMAFFLFMVAGFAETNRLPFDLPEGESELGGGFHTEYSSMKFAMFFMAEYMNMFTFSAVLTTLFLGGFSGPIPSPFAALGVPNAIWGLAWFSVKVFFLISFMIFIRGTWPRFRYDQLMDLGWKFMLPVALINMVLTAGVIALAETVWPTGGEQLGSRVTLILLVAGIIQIIVCDRILTLRKRRLLRYAG